MKFIGILTQVLLVLLVVPPSAIADDFKFLPGMLIPKLDTSLDGQQAKRSQVPSANGVTPSDQRTSPRLTLPGLTTPSLTSSSVKSGSANSPSLNSSGAAASRVNSSAASTSATGLSGVTSSVTKIGATRVVSGKREIAALNRTDLQASGARVGEAEALLKQLYGWSCTLTVVIDAPVTSKTANFGDIVEARLTQDFRFGNKLIASKNSIVRGHIVSVIAARTLSAAVLSRDRKFNSRACMTLQFDEIIDQDGRRWPIVASPCRQDNVITNRATSGRQVKTDTQGRIVRASATLSQNQRTAYNATKVATMVPLPTTILINTLGVPAAMSVVGAASPSVAYNKPIEQKDSHTRTKAATYAFLTNLPGAILVQSVVEKGDQVELVAGDELVLNLAIRESGYRFPAPSTDLNVTGAVVVEPKKSNRLYPAESTATQHSTLLPVSNVAVAAGSASAGSASAAAGVPSVPPTAAPTAATPGSSPSSRAAAMPPNRSLSLRGPM